MKKVLYLLLLVIVLASCRSAKQVVSTPVPAPPRYLSSKLQLTVPTGSSTLTLGGTLKLKERERIQLSILMPILRTEVARLEITPDEVLLIDRMGKRYVRASRVELSPLLPGELILSKIEKKIFDASLPGAKAELTGEELGIPSLEKSKIRLYEFSSDEFVVMPTEVSDRYTQVPLQELLNMLINL